MLVGFACALAWDTSGSISSADWLPYAVAACFVLAAVLLAGVASRPSRLPLAAASLLVAFAVWTALSAAWSPLPSLARDDGLLALLYAVAFITALVTLRSATDRLSAMLVVVGGLTALMLATAVSLRGSVDPKLAFSAGRLDFPVSYWNGEAAMALVALWPAIALSAERQLHAAVRGLALGGATAMLALWIGTQSKGGGVTLAASAIVVFAVSSARLRLLVPMCLAAGVAAIGAAPLTEPFRTEGAAFDAAVHHAGTVTIGLFALATVLGVAYAVVDERVRVSNRERRLAGFAVAAAALTLTLAGIGAFFANVSHPLGWTETRWDDFKHLDAAAPSASHFGQLGSNRYDFWRVALDEFVAHPVAGVGGHGWAAAYLRHGASDETPQRAHSLELDALSETGLIGALLVVAAGLLALVAVGRLAGESLLAAGALGTGVYFAAHASGDWIWTIPAVGLPVFVIVGIGASGDGDRMLPMRTAVVSGIGAILIGSLAFAPPWLSSRLVDHAYHASTPANDLRWARRLDPLAVEPLIAESALEPERRARIAPLERARAKQPRDAELYYLLGLAYLDAGRKIDATRVLRTALVLSPRDDAILVALRHAR